MALDLELRLSIFPCATIKRRPVDGSVEANLSPPPISNLGDDLLAEVLIRVPEPGSAWRCKAVCKRWKSLISDPQFVRRFVSHHESIWSVDEPPLMAIDSGEAILSFLPVPDELADRWYFRIFDSFKDLVLCGFQETPRIHSEFSRSLFVCNPFTKQWVALPLAPEIASSSKIGSFVARLVCEPLTCSSNVELDLGEGRPPLVYCSAYRFRVLCIYQMMKSTRVDVFCSESGEWTKEALVLDEHYILLACNGISSLCNSGLLWLCLDAENRGSIPYIIAGFNPFGLDIPPTCINASSLVVSRCKWNISVSQGALHLIVLEAEAPPAPLSIWRLEEDGKFWRIQYKTLLGRTSGRCNYELKECSVVGLHPEKPHIVFLRHEDLGGPWDDVVLSYDSRTEELRYFAEFLGNWAVFHPSVSCWPTPIPRYEKLRVIYDGSYKCWVQQSSSKATTPFPNNCGMPAS